jgi:hypothetical protein
VLSRLCTVAHVYGHDKALLALRMFCHSKMDAAYMADLMRCVDMLAMSCHVNKAGKPDGRGDFPQMLIGWNHGKGMGKNVSLLPTFAFPLQGA